MSKATSYLDSPPGRSVHSFQGLEAGGWQEAETALDWLREAGKRFKLLTITEVRNEAQVDLAARYIDILQIGTRNMYNQDGQQTITPGELEDITNSCRKIHQLVAPVRNKG